MLRYRHAFHAGNHGDVIKHSVLTFLAAHLQKHTNSFVFIDTHAGAGRYDLYAKEAQKNREFNSGILPLWQRKDLPSGLRTYIRIVETMNPNGKLRWYPGSPWLARQLMRKQDKAHLFELHSNEVHNLRTLLAKERHIKVEHADGLQAINGIQPPLEHQVLLLIDPSYEGKGDFVRAVCSLKNAYRHFSLGTYMLWYPVIDRAYITLLENDLHCSAVRNILLAELMVKPESTPGMTGSGIIVINPPWTLRESLQQALPYLAEVLGTVNHAENSGSYRLQMLVPE